MIPFDVRLANFLDSVSFVADKSLQQRVWGKGEAGSSIRSLGELYAQFFDDNEIDDFIANEMKNAPLSDLQRHAITDFRDALNAFSGAPEKNNRRCSDAELLNDSEWNALVVLAISTKAMFG